MSFYLGIDGGGTRTTAIVCDENGKFLGRAVGGSLNHNSVGLPTARKNLSEVISQLTEKIGCESFDSVCIGSAAMSGRATEQVKKRLTDGIIKSDKIILDSDIFIAMECLLDSGPCAVVISGTGSMVAARDEKGKLTHSGGWGYLLGDDGSGYRIAVDAIRCAVRSIDGSEPETTLVGEMLEFFDVYKPEELIDKFYTEGVSNSKISMFAGRVFFCANNGDEAAKRIVCNHARLLAGTTKNLLKDFPPDTAIGLWGGVFVNNRMFRNEFAISMLEQSGEYRMKLLNYPAECGALFAAYALDGVALNDTIMKNIDVYRGVRV